MKLKAILIAALMLSFTLSVSAANKRKLKDPAAAPEVQDVVYYGEKRPILIRLHVYLDGEPYSKRYLKYIEEAFKYADRDGSGFLDRDETNFVPSTQDLTRLFQGYPSYYRPGTMTNQFPQMDPNEDRRVSLEELFEYYHRANIVPLRLVAPRNTFNPSPVLSEELFKALDLNKDKMLSADELKTSRRLVELLDDDEDETVGMLEIATQQQLYQRRNLGGNIRGNPQGGMRQPGMSGASISGRFHLIPKAKGTTGLGERLKLSKAIITRYDKDKTNRLSRDELGVDKKTFQWLDGNGNNVIDPTELMLRWLTVRPDVEMTIRLGKRKGTEQAVELIRGSEGLKARQSGSGSVRIPLSDFDLDVKSLTSLTGINYNAQRFYLTQFQQVSKQYTDGKIPISVLKKSTNYYLRGLGEIANTDGDESLTQKEVEAYVDLQASAANCTVSLQVLELGQGLFEMIDTSGDRRLSGRELAEAGKKLMSRDQNKDGKLELAEIPNQFQLVLNPGRVNYANQSIPRPGTTAVQNRSGPLWFQKMDRNGDGDVSRREFLGSQKKFHELDTNGDGYLSEKEAQKIESKQASK